MGLLRQRVNTELECDILTMLIANTEFINKVHQWYKPEYFTDYGKVIAKWVIEYYNEWGSAPQMHIQNIYNVEKENLPQALSQNIATYLENLSAKYESKKDINLDYMVEQARGYFKTKSYELLFLRGRELMMAGRHNDAFRLHEEFRDTVQRTSKWENPFDEKVIKQHFYELENNLNEIVCFSGVLGQLTGTLERCWLVAIMGPMKSQKSFWQQELVFLGVANKKRVAYVNFEMPNSSMRTREYKRMVGLRDTPGTVRIPTFDCVLNQIGQGCPIPRTRAQFNDIKLREMDSRPPKYRPGMDYRVCTWCRDNKQHWAVEKEDNPFIPAVWFSEYSQQGAFTKEAVLKTAKGYILQYGDRLRHISYPAFSAKIKDVRKDLKELEYSEGFVPDIVVVDYGDIAAKYNSGDSDLTHFDEVWKSMKRYAGEMNALWVSASQTNRGAIDKKHINQKDTAGDIRKVAHVDAMFGLNITEADKASFVTRINVLAHRHKDFSKREVAVLHQLDIGIPYLDSEWWGTYEKEEEE